MNKKINNILLVIFPVVALIVHGIYNNIMLENRARLYKFNPAFLIGIFLYFIVFGIFVYSFLVKDKDFNIAAVVIGGLISIPVLSPLLSFSLLSVELIPGGLLADYIIRIHTSDSTFYMGLMILTIYALIGIKKFKEKKNVQ